MLVLSSLVWWVRPPFLPRNLAIEWWTKDSLASRPGAKFWVEILKCDKFHGFLGLSKLQTAIYTWIHSGFLGRIWGKYTRIQSYLVNPAFLCPLISITVLVTYVFSILMHDKLKDTHSLLIVSTCQVTFLTGGYATHGVRTGENKVMLESYMEAKCVVCRSMV